MMQRILIEHGEHSISAVQQHGRGMVWSRRSKEVFEPIRKPKVGTSRLQT